MSGFYGSCNRFTKKTEVSQVILYKHFDELSSTLNAKIENIYGPFVKVASRKFVSSSTARFTVTFSEWQNNPDAIQDKINSIIQETISEITNRYKNINYA